MLSYFLFWIIQLPFLLLRPHKVGCSHYMVYAFSRAFLRAQLRYLFLAKASQLSSNLFLSATFIVADSYCSKLWFSYDDLGICEDWGRAHFFPAGHSSRLCSQLGMAEVYRCSQLRHFIIHNTYFISCMNAVIGNYATLAVSCYSFSPVSSLICPQVK
jgi:hypothetical protein